MKKLTIGSAVYDDFEGVYFTYQSIRLNNMDIWDDLDLVIIDNNPESAEGNATRQFCDGTRGIRYIPYTDRRSTSVRNEIFTNSEADFCMSIDPHVLFEPDTIKRLISFFEDHPTTSDLYHGPMFYDIIQGHDPCSKMNPVWRDNMLGTWAGDKRGNDKDNDPFEIEMHGLGIFACRTKAWLGFNEGFVGFGGEEGYIHKKFKAEGHKIWCLPFLRWVHRFQRPLGVKYPLITEERIKNYLIGHKELGLPFDEIIEHFGETQPSIDVKAIIDNLDNDSPVQLELVDDPPEQAPPPNATPKGREIKLWEKSAIDFKGISPIRYIKYEILRSYDGYAALREIKIGQPIPENAKIHSVSSEDPKKLASNILKSTGDWVTHPSSQNKTPHELIIDFGEEIFVDQVVTIPRPGLDRGLPVEFKVYNSLDLVSWEELSHVNILED